MLICCQEESKRQLETSKKSRLVVGSFFLFWLKAVLSLKIYFYSSTCFQNYAFFILLSVNQDKVKSFPMKDWKIRTKKKKRRWKVSEWKHPSIHVLVFNVGYQMTIKEEQVDLILFPISLSWVVPHIQTFNSSLCIWLWDVYPVISGGLKEMGCSFALDIFLHYISKKAIFQMTPWKNW